MFRNILVPVDGSEFNNKAIEIAIEVAYKFDSNIIAVHVLNEFSTSSYATDEDNGDELLHNVSLKAKEKNINVIEHLITGDPLRDMNTIIQKSKADLVVISAHGKDFINEKNPSNHLGSVVERVLKSSIVPVLLIK